MGNYLDESDDMSVEIEASFGSRTLRGCCEEDLDACKKDWQQDFRYFQHKRET